MNEDFMNVVLHGSDVGTLMEALAKHGVTRIDKDTLVTRRNMEAMKECADSACAALLTPEAATTIEHVPDPRDQSVDVGESAADTAAPEPDVTSS